MAVSQVGGTSNQSTTNVTTLTGTYSPTTGNAVILFLNLSGGVGSLTVKDSAGNVLTGPTTVSTTFSVWYQSSVPAGITSYTATWTGGVQCSIALEEYSGSSGVVIAGTNVGNSATATISISSYNNNDWIVAGFGAASTFTTTVGNSRQGTSTSTARVKLQDNTSATPASITNTATLSSTTWAAIAVLLGGTGFVRDTQDVPLSVSQPTTAKIRDTQDLPLSVSQPTTAKIRDTQDLSLAVGQVSAPNVRVSQDLTLVLLTILPFNAALLPHDDENQKPKDYWNQGIANADGSETVFVVVRKNFYIVSFVST